MALLRRYQLLILVCGIASIVAAFEFTGHTWRLNPYADARNLPPEADAALAIWPDAPESDYARSLEALQLRFDLEEARSHLERARARGMPVEERILHEYLNVLTLMRAEPFLIEAVSREWHRHFPDRDAFYPPLTAAQEFPARQQAGSLFSSTLSPNGRLLATLRGPGKIDLAEVVAGREQRQVDTRAQRAELPLAFSRDSKLLATADEDHAVTIWDVATLQPRVRLVGHADRVYGIAFDPENGQCATGSRDRSVRVWDIENGEPLAVLNGLRRPVSALAFSGDGGMLAIGNWSGEIELWDVDAGKKAQTFSGHRGAVTTLVFSPRGTSLVSASRDATVRLWNISGKSHLVTQHEAAVGCAMFLGDGRVLASGGSDGVVQFWDLATGRQLHAMQAGGRVFGLGFSDDTRSLGVATLVNQAPKVVHYALP